MFLARHPDGLPPPGPTVGPVADAEVRPARLTPAVLAGAIVVLIVLLVLAWRAIGLPAPAADPPGASPPAASVGPAVPARAAGDGRGDPHAADRAAADAVDDEVRGAATRRLEALPRKTVSADSDSEPADGVARRPAGVRRPPIPIASATTRP